MGYYSFYRILKDAIRSLFGSKGWKIFLILLIAIIILSLKNCVFGADYTISQAQIDKAFSMLDDTYTRFSCQMYRNRKTIFLIGNENVGVWSDGTLLQATKGRSIAWKLYWYNDTDNSVSLFWKGTNTGHGALDMTHMYANFNIYDNSQETGGYYYEYIPPVVITQPSFISTVEDLESEQNSYLKINQGSFMDSIYLRLYNNTTNSLLFESKLTSYEDYMVRENLEDPFSNLIYSIPYSALPSFKLISGNNFEYRLVYRNENNELSSVSMYFTPSITQEVNGVSDKEINDSIKETNDSIKDMNNTMKDTSDKLFSDEYDESKINISTAESDKVDDTQITNFVTSLLQNIQNIATGNWNNVEIISFDLRFCG